MAWLNELIDWGVLLLLVYVGYAAHAQADKLSGAAVLVALGLWVARRRLGPA